MFALSQDSTPQVRRAGPRDEIGILRLLTKFQNRSVAQKDWARLLHYPWRKDSDPWGFVLEDKGQIVGFLGTVMSRQVLSGEEKTIGNMTSWWVEPEYAGLGAYLLKEFVESEADVLTNFSASPAVEKGLIKLGFQVVDEKAWRWNFFQLIRKSPAVRLISHGACRGNIEFMDFQRLSWDHKDTLARELVAEVQGQPFYALWRLKGRYRRTAWFDWVSDPKVLESIVPSLMRKLLIHYGVTSMAVESRFFEKTPRGAKSVALSHRRLALSKAGEGKLSSLSGGYSELVLLPL